MMHCRPIMVRMRNGKRPSCIIPSSHGIPTTRYATVIWAASCNAPKRIYHASNVLYDDDVNLDECFGVLMDIMVLDAKSRRTLLWMDDHDSFPQGLVGHRWNCSLTGSAFLAPWFAFSFEWGILWDYVISPITREREWEIQSEIRFCILHLHGLVAVYTYRQQEFENRSVNFLWSSGVMLWCGGNPNCDNAGIHYMMVTIVDIPICQRWFKGHNLNLKVQLYSIVLYVCIHVFVTSILSPVFVSCNVRTDVPNLIGGIGLTSAVWKNEEWKPIIRPPARKSSRILRKAQHSSRTCTVQ